MEAGELVLSSRHEKAGATWGREHDYRIPAHYGDPVAEYDACVEGAAVRDESHAGSLAIAGPDAIDFLNRLSTAAVLELADGGGMVNCLVTDKGRVIDVFVTLREGDGVRLLTSPGAADGVREQLERFHITEELEIRADTRAWCLFGLYGPQSIDVAAASCGRDDLGELADYVPEPVEISGAEALLLRRPSPLGAFAVLVSSNGADRIWEELESLGARPMGSEAHEPIRIEWGWPEFGREISRRYNPLELGLAAAVSFDKGCYVGQEVIARLDTYAKVGRLRIGLLFESPETVAPPPGESWPLMVRERRVGEVTSVAPVPGEGRSVGQAILKADQFEEDGRCRVVMGDTGVEALMFGFAEGT